jgi:hypothetical protein
MPHTANWDIEEPGVADALQAYRGAIVSEVDRTIVTPGAGDRPLWMSKPGLRLIAQFKSFAFSSTSKTIMAGADNRDMAALQGAVLMTVLGTMVAGLKFRGSVEELMDKDFGWWVHQGVDRSGLLGSVMEYNNVVERWTRNQVGLGFFTGEISQRYQARNAMSAILGPTFGLGNDLIRVLGNAAAGDIQASDVGTFRRAVPLQNLFYLRFMFDALEEATVDVFGLSESDKRKDKAKSSFGN